MDRDHLLATFEYWQECGIHFLAGDSLEFSGKRLPIPKRNLPTVDAKEPAASLHETIPKCQTPEQQPQRAVPPPIPSYLASPPLPMAARSERLEKMAAELTGCRRCELSLARNQTVFGMGAVDAPVVFVGEGPGADEDRLGQPFVGQAGKLLNQMIQTIGYTRNQVYIANVVKCRPPGNRTPLSAEIASCQGFLFEQLEIIRPKVIFTLGQTAIQCLLGAADVVTRMRGKTLNWRGIQVIASYHPAFYLRSPARKKAAWEDLLRLQKMLEEAP